MKANVIKYLTLAAKAASFVAGLAVYADVLPPKYAPIAALVFAAASLSKDTVNRIGDLADDGVKNDSFKP